MKRIHLLRHAKSSWRDPTLADHDRPLSERGEDAGLRVAAWIAEQRLQPQLVLCSTATRARRTLEIVLPSLGAAGLATVPSATAPKPGRPAAPVGAYRPVVSFETGLYHASAEALLERVQELDDDLDDVMLVGHNPGLQDLALLLSAPSPERERIAAKLPTGALVTIELGRDWAAADLGDGAVAALALPREL